MRKFALLGIMVFAADASVARADRLDREEIRRLVRELDRQSDDFKRQFERALDHSRLDGTSWEHRLNQQVKELDRAIDRLKHGLEHHRDVWDIREEVRDVVEQGSDVNRIMIRLELHRHVEREWRALRDGINLLARQYRVRGISG